VTAVDVAMPREAVLSGDVGQPVSRRLLRRGERQGAKRMAVNVPAPVWQMLKALADASGHKIVDELCQAVAFWHFVDQERSEGAKILIESGHDHQLRELYFVD